MKKTDRAKTNGKAKLEPVHSVKDILRRELRDFIHHVGRVALAELLEEDRTALCGPAYARGQTGPHRAGSTVGELILGGQRVRVTRPRVRDARGEVILPSWEEFSNADPLDERAFEQMVIGVPTRKYERSLEAVPEDIATRGTTKSAVSRRFVAASQKQLDALLARNIGELSLCAIMMDGIHIGNHLVLLALGIDDQGKKHVLGLWEGATENKAVCLTMLNDLIKRGLDPMRSMLFVIDGGLGLRSALRAVFGKRALVQRCQVHKRRNVLDHLGKELHPSINKALRDAYTSKSDVSAKKRLKALAQSLKSDHPSASASVLEGLDETLTIKKMKLPRLLERTLSTTNAIENLNGGVRAISRRVRRWQGGSMVCRWVAAAVLEREKSFRRIKGYKGLKALRIHLSRNDEQLGLDATLESDQRAS